MINIDEINSEIKKLEECPLTYSLCEKLASLYIIKDYYEKHYMQNNLEIKPKI